MPGKDASPTAGKQVGRRTTADGKQKTENRKQKTINHPPIIRTRDGSPTLHSERFGETYHSMHGALAEARHVFLECGLVQARLEDALPTRVLEIGFGTGMNFLLAAHVAHRTGTPLHFESFETSPLPATTLALLDLGRITGAVEHEKALMEAVSAHEKKSSPGNRILVEGSGSVSLTIRVEDAASSSLPHRSFDAIYHDAFSPRANPDLWTEDVLGRLAETLRPGARLVTYSVAGDVRRRLTEAGLDVAKAPGPPGGKREMLVATRKCE